MRISPDCVARFVIIPALYGTFSRYIILAVAPRSFKYCMTFTIPSSPFVLMAATAELLVAARVSIFSVPLCGLIAPPPRSITISVMAILPPGSFTESTEPPSAFMISCSVIQETVLP